MKHGGHIQGAYINSFFARESAKFLWKVHSLSP